MRAAWIAFAVSFAVCTTLAFMTAAPVGVSAEDVRAVAEATQTINPDLPADAAIQKAADHLEKKQRSRLTYLFSAYLVLWGLLGLYLYTLARKQARIEAELKRLSALWEDAPEDSVG